MKLAYYSTQTLPKAKGTKSKSARVTLGKTGTISFNDTATALMALKPGDKVTLSQDEDEPGNWYFFKDPANGFELRSGYENRGCLFNHKGLIEKLVSSVEKDVSITHTFLIAGQPTEIKGDKAKTQYWGILIP